MSNFARSTLKQTTTAETLQRGSIYNRPSGFTIAYPKPDGKQKWEGGFPTKAAAQDRLT